MGMHFGVLASELSSRELIERIGALAPEMHEGAVLRSADEIDLEPGDDDWPLVAGDLDGRGYLIDSSFLLSGMEPDLVATLARESGKLVVGVAAETVSGTFVCVVACAGEVLRHHYQCNAELRSAYSEGKPFAVEARTPLDDIDGGGLVGILRELGFDYDAMLERGKKRHVRWTSMASRVVPDGPLAARVEAHRETAMLPKDQRPSPRIVMRVTSGGAAFDIASGPTPAKKPWWQFW